MRMCDGVLHSDKVEAIRQWTADPCGAVDGLDAESRAYWQRVDVNRYERYAPWMRETLGFDRHPGKRVLEVGFGLGTDLMQFALGGSTVYGVDLTPRHVDLASRRFRAFGVRAILLPGDVEFLPYASDSFDVVYSFGVLHHTPDITGAIREIHRVLRPGGTLIVAVYHKYSLVMAWRVVVEGVLRTRLVSESWRAFLSGVEYRTNPASATPLVRLYSRSELLRLLQRFSGVRVVVRHSGVTVESSGWLKPAVKRLVSGLVGDHVLGSRFGWYLIAFAIK